MNGEVAYPEKNHSYWGCILCGRMGEDERAENPITRMHERLGYDVCIECSGLYSDEELKKKLKKGVKFHGCNKK